MANDGKFRHESLQDRKSIRALLDSIAKGIGKGELTLADGNDELVLPLDGLLTLRVKADRADGNCRIDLRISWRDSDKDVDQRSVPVVK